MKRNSPARRSFKKALAARFSPLAVVLTVASLFIGLGIVARYMRSETVEAQITLEELARRRVEKRAPSVSREIAFGDNDLSVRYAERLREGSALTLGFSLYVLNERITNRRVTPNIKAALDGVQASALLPPHMIVVNSSGVVQSPLGLYYIRFRPEPFGVEVLAVGAKGLDSGDVFIIRIPENSAVPTDGLPQSQIAGGYATVFTAPNFDAPVPKPFSTVSQFMSAGWTQQVLRATPHTAQQVAELRTWVAKQVSK